MDVLGGFGLFRMGGVPGMDKVSQTMIELKDCDADAACAVPGESHCLGHCGLVSGLDDPCLTPGLCTPQSDSLSGTEAAVVQRLWTIHQHPERSTLHQAGKIDPDSHLQVVK
ncbi:hypothetical protein DPMN_087435 [Dreissena polymorpha]|uniref:Uncharacterized protein n=1 Tax=Dreissena polymorpha TaxID=45954 RepID=A0A9D4QWD3_DREPO|nr:hypothetical protein DPMN_087435 [Dreissena polymorpha]